MITCNMNIKFAGILLLIFFALPIAVSANVVINEIAWMGTANSAADEWLEFENNGANDIDLTGWILEAQDGTPSVPLVGVISAGGFFLLERTDDTTVPGVIADLIYAGALSNSGEVLTLKDAGGNIIDSVDASAGWLAGDNTTKETMQRVGEGNGWVTAPATPRAPTPFGEVLKPAGEETPESNDSSSSSGGIPYVPPELLSSIKAYAGKDRESVAGAEVLLEGKAFGWKDEPLDSATTRFLWNFGDGVLQDGQNVSHIYIYPGLYIATLSVILGRETVSDFITVAVGENPVFISEISPGSNGWIELSNPSSKSVDISRWIIKNSFGDRFVFPNGTNLSARSLVVFLAEIMRVELSNQNPRATLLYPNGKVADELFYNGFVGESSIVSDENEVGDVKAFLATPTPGAKNVQHSMLDSAADTKSSVFNKKVAIESGIKHQVLDNRTEETVSEDAVDLPEEVLGANLESQESSLLASVFDSNLFWLALSIVLGALIGALFLFFRKFFY